MNGSNDQTASGTTVVLPHQLRERCGGRHAVELAGATVRELLRSLERRYPGISFTICYENGELREFVNVFVGQQNVKYLNGLDTPVEGERVHIIHSVAGGCGVSQASRHVIPCAVRIETPLRRRE